MNKQPVTTVGGVHVGAFDEAGDNLARLINELQKIDITKPIAKINEISITDNNGGRIEL